MLFECTETTLTGFGFGLGVQTDDKDRDSLYALTSPWVIARRFWLFMCANIFDSFMGDVVANHSSKCVIIDVSFEII